MFNSACSMNIGADPATTTPRISGMRLIKINHSSTKTREHGVFLPLRICHNSGGLRPRAIQTPVRHPRPARATALRSALPGGQPHPEADLGRCSPPLCALIPVLCGAFQSKPAPQSSTFQSLALRALSSIAFPVWPKPLKHARPHQKGITTRAMPTITRPRGAGRALIKLDVAAVQEP